MDVSGVLAWLWHVVCWRSRTVEASDWWDNWAHLTIGGLLIVLYRIPSCIRFMSLDTNLYASRQSALVHGTRDERGRNSDSGMVGGQGFCGSSGSGAEEEGNWSIIGSRECRWYVIETYSLSTRTSLDNIDQMQLAGPFRYSELIQGGKIANFRRMCLCSGVQVMQQFSGANMIKWVVNCTKMSKFTGILQLPCTYRVPEYYGHVSKLVFNPWRCDSLYVYGGFLHSPLGTFVAAHTIPTPRCNSDCPSRRLTATDDELSWWSRLQVYRFASSLQPPYYPPGYVPLRLGPQRWYFSSKSF